MSKAKKRYNFENRKSIHTTMSLGTHSEFRIKLMRKGLSMQEVFEEFSQRIAADMSDMTDILEDIALKKKNKEIKKFSETDVKRLTDILYLHPV